MRLSIVIPAYNEETRLPPTLERIHEFFKDRRDLKGQPYSYEVIVVDDGSKDRTVEVAKMSRLYKEGALKVLENGQNKGKGFSIKNGMRAAQGGLVLFSDADLSTPIEEFDKLLEGITQGCDIAIGSRSAPGAQILVRQPWHRQLVGRLFNLSVQLLVVPGIGDTQCGFKLFKAEAARKIVPLMRIDGFVFDVEMLYLGKKYGFTIKEFPVVWRNSAGTSVSLLNHFFQVSQELLSIRKIHNED